MSREQIPILAVVGWSDSGKTTFVTTLVEALTKKGYKVATIKHNAHKFQIDKPGKDSWQHRQAGAETVLISSAEKLAMIKSLEQQPKVETMVADYIDESYDLVVVEGYKSGSVPEIEIFRPALYDESVLEGEELLARVVNNGTKEDLKEQAKMLISNIEDKLLLV
jgi:molybdopterin-guanine dinucleotide biosynthesis protein B